MDEIAKHYLYPSALFTEKAPHIVDTVLGSCVAVCLSTGWHRWAVSTRSTCWNALLPGTFRTASNVPGMRHLELATNLRQIAQKSLCSVCNSNWNPRRLRRAICAKRQKIAEFRWNVNRKLETSLSMNKHSDSFFFSSSDTWDVIACISRPVSQLERLDLMSTTPFLFSIAGNAIFKRIQRFYWPDRQFYFLNYFGENRTTSFYNCCQWYNSHFERIYIFYKIFKYIFS